MNWESQKGPSGTIVTIAWLPMAQEMQFSPHSFSMHPLLAIFVFILGKPNTMTPEDLGINLIHRLLLEEVKSMVHQAMVKEWFTYVILTHSRLTPSF